MDLSTMRDFAIRYTAAWCSQDASSVASFYAELGSLKINNGSPSIGRKEIMAAAQEFMTAFPDMIVKMDDLQQKGDSFIFRWTFIGSNIGPGGTGKRVHFSGFEEWTVNADGLIEKSLGHFDEAEYERQRKFGAGVILETDVLRAILKSQYHATLGMLRQAIEACPDEMWFNKEHPNSVWQIAYHALFFAHLYMQPDEAAFSPWEHHQSEVQNPDGIGGPPDPNSNLPLIPAPYSKAEVLDYWNICEQMVDNAIDALDLQSPQSGFSWYKMPKLEHQIVNIRHIQHHVAQLADRLRSSANIPVKWIGGVRAK